MTSVVDGPLRHRRHPAVGASPEGTAAARFYGMLASRTQVPQAHADRLISGFVEDHPDEAHEVLFGAAALLAVERSFAEHLSSCWGSGRFSSLLAPLHECARRVVAVLQATS